MTLGFGDPRTTLQNKVFHTERGSFVGHAAAVGTLRRGAEELLRAVDEGLQAGPLARALAVEVLRSTVPDSPSWTLAISVLEGGPLRMRRAVELAGLVFEAADVEGEAGVCSSG